MLFSSIENIESVVVAENIVAEAYRRIGVRAEFRRMSGSRAALESSSGRTAGEVIRIESFSDLYPTLQRIETPIMSILSYAYVLDPELVDIDSETLSTLKVGVLRGLKFSDDITDGVEEVIRVTDQEILVNMLLKKRLDLVILTEVTAQKMLRKLDSRNLIIRHTKPIYILNLHHFVHERFRHLAPKINNSINDMKEDGTLDAFISSMADAK